MSIPIQLPPITLGQAGGSQHTLALSAGQSVEARVLGQQGNGTTQVQIGRQTLNLALNSAPPVGTTLTFSVQQVEGQLRLMLLSALPPGTTAPAAPSSGSVPAATVQLSAAALAGTTGQSPSATPLAVAPAAPQNGPQPVRLSSIAVRVAAEPGSLNAQTQSGGPVPPQPPSTSASPAGATTGAGSGASSGGTATQTALAGSASIVPSTAARPLNPYAPATAISSPVAATAPVGSATTALPPIAGAIATGLAGQHAPSTGQSGIGSSTPQPPLQSGQPPSAANPQAALTQMVQQALPRQGSIVGLTTALSAAVERIALPEPVLKAAQQVLAQRLSLDGGQLDGAAVQKAVQNSGIFQEALLASGRGQAAGGDLKTAMLGLQRQLGAWLGNQAAIDQVGAIAPPLRGQVPRARAGEAPPPDLPEDPVETGKLLLERTDAALSRLRLHQNASLPDPVSRHEAQWSLDLPVTVAGQQSLLQMQIHRDEDGAATRPEDRGWQVRFAINLSDLGEVGAQVTLRGAVVGVMLWADRDETAQVLAGNVDMLRDTFTQSGLTPGAIVVRSGAPVNAPPAPSGHVVDAIR